VRGKQGRRSADLLRALHDTGAETQALQLIERLPGAGMFPLFCKQEARREQFRFGREADGRPDTRWHWEDLGHIMIIP
jgi:hypothetical protein